MRKVQSDFIQKLGNLLFCTSMYKNTIFKATVEVGTNYILYIIICPERLIHFKSMIELASFRLYNNLSIAQDLKI